MRDPRAPRPTVRTLLSTAAAPNALGAALAVALTAGAASAALPQVTYQLTGTQLTQVTVDGVTLSADDLAPGTSSGAVQFLDSGGQPIDAADDLDLATYFARANVSPDLWAVEFDPPWRDLSGPSDDFFLLEAGGNDLVRAAARLADGSLGAEVQLGGWQSLGAAVFTGPNSGQVVHALSFSGSDLLDPTGAPLDAGDELAGVELYSATIDGAVFARRALPADPLWRPTIEADANAVPFGDLNQTQVTLTAALPLGAPPQQYAWSIPKASYHAGTGPNDAQVVITLPGFDVTEVELVTSPLTDPQAIQKAHRSLGLELPGGGVELHGSPRQWQKLELWFDGPPFAATDSGPNPFLDRRLDVAFTGPHGSVVVVPGFFDGDGHGGASGDVWKVRFVPDAPGTWSWAASFRAGSGVAVAADPLAGWSSDFDGLAGVVAIEPRDPAAPGFLAGGRLVWTDRGYRKQVDGGYWIKGGSNSPENLFAYRGFVGTADQNGLDGLHEYGPHEADWTADDPDLPLGTFVGDRGLIGALNYLESEGVNGLYFLPHNLGGDGWDTTPFIGYTNSGFDKTHFALDRLLQWETVLWAATRRGIHLQFVLAETEPANETWLDGGEFGTERKLYFRELVARFGHHLGLKWNLSEENDFDAAQLAAMANWLRDLDPYDSSIAFHVKPNMVDSYLPFYGNPDFDSASIQYDPDLAGTLCEEVRAASIAAGHPWIVELDENTPPTTGLTDANADDLRKRVLWDVYLSGGQIEWYAGQSPLPLGGDTTLEDFRTREEMWRYTRFAREFLELLPFWLMEPADQLVGGEVQAFGGGEVFARTGHVYAVFLPDASAGASLDLSGAPGPFELSWFDPRQGAFVGGTTKLQGGGPVALGKPPASPGEDWVALVRRPTFWTTTAIVSATTGGVVALELDGTPALAGWVYLTTGSLTGTAPGFPLANGSTLPLVPDAYTLLTLFGGAPLSGSAGVLDDTGRATATLTLPPAPGMVGLRIHHAWIAGPLVENVVSEPVSVTYGP